MNTYALPELKIGSYYTSDLLLDKTFLLCSPTCPVSNDLVKALQKWGFREVISEGKEGVALTEETPSGPVDEKGFEEISIEQALGEVEKKEEEKNPVLTVNKKIQEAIANTNTQKSLAVSAAESEKSRMQNVQAVYDEYLNFIKTVYTHYATHKQINLTEISETVKELCIYIKENRRYVLRIISPLKNDKEFLVRHSMRTTVLSITIGLQLRMSLSKLVELGVASILHEIGMICLPPQLYMTDKPLNTSEKNLIARHTVIGFNILKRAEFPLTIQLGVLDHHERETGTGYPRHLTGAKISPYAKIIAIACSYEAITAPRHYREARTTYEAMVELLKNENHQYDDSVVKALLYSLSIFPIGAYVYMSNGKIGQVIDIEPENPKAPVVQIVGESAKDGSPIQLKTNGSNIKIVRVMNQKEADDVLQALKKWKDGLK